MNLGIWMQTEDIYRKDKSHVSQVPNELREGQWEEERGAESEQKR